MFSSPAATVIRAFEMQKAANPDMPTNAIDAVLGNTLPIDGRTDGLTLDRTEPTLWEMEREGEQDRPQRLHGQKRRHHRRSDLMSCVHA